MSAYAFVLAQHHEVEVDRSSANDGGSATVAMALTALERSTRYEHEVV